MTAEKYRIHAAQCVLLAGEMRDPDHKAALVAMARAWTRLGEFIDAQQDVPAPAWRPDMQAPAVVQDGRKTD